MDTVRYRKVCRGWTRAWSLAVGSAGLVASAVFMAVGLAGANPRFDAIASPLQVALDAAPEAGAAGDWACVRCHKFEKVLTHPTGVAPQAAPPGLPLLEGLVGCTTCHEDRAGHAERREKIGVRIQGNGLCVECHQTSISGNGPRSERAKVAHVGVGRAHFKPGNTGAAPGNGVDGESATCMACHDGATASDAGSHAASKMADGSTADHPIGIKLVAGRAKDGDFRMASPSTLDKRIRLTGGTLGCGSCHSVYSHEKGDLVISNRGSALCMACHVP